MSTKLKGFVELPFGDGNILHIRLASIDAVWFGRKATLIQLHGCPDSDDAFHISLGLEEVIVLIAAAQDG